MCEGESVINEEGVCVPCPPGTFFHQNTFQTDPGVCVPCRNGASGPIPDSYTCLCDPGWAPYERRDYLITVSDTYGYQAAFWFDDLGIGFDHPETAEYDPDLVVQALEARMARSLAGYFVSWSNRNNEIDSCLPCPVG
eukprot:3582128-Rhodomonas_salina.1